MITFNNLGGFLFYTFITCFVTFSLTIFIQSIVENRNKKRKWTNKQTAPPIKVGEVYGKYKADENKNDPFISKEALSYCFVIIDIKPAIDGDGWYYQYVFLNDYGIPYSHYNNGMLYSSEYSTDRFNRFQLIKVIDVKTLKFE